MCLIINKLKRFSLLLFFALAATLAASGQTCHKEVVVDFPLNSTVLDEGFSENKRHLEEILSLLDGSKGDVVSLSFCGSASPEGPSELNRRLASGRLAALESYIRSRRTDIPEDIITRSSTHIPWDFLKEEIERGGTIDYKSEILATLSEQALDEALKDDGASERIIARLQSIGGGAAWKTLLEKYFSGMRSASVVFILVKDEEPQFEEEDHPEDEPLNIKDDVLTPVDIPEAPEPVEVVTPEVPAPQYSPKFSIGTNALEWIGAGTNVSFEVDLCPHLSLFVPVGYCAWNYFRSDLKFRYLYFQPELRCYFKGNDGFWAGAHFGLGSYNIAYCKTYRIQDHDGKSPAIGGGIALGYRMPLSKDGHWKVGFSLGCGVYRLHYDRFRNVTDGLLVDTVRRTRFAADRASVTFSYMFDLKRKGR